MEYHAIEDAEAWHKIQDVLEERVKAGVEIKNDLIRTMGECRDVTDQYCTGRSAYLRLGQLFMRLFAGLL
jgi:hypothetical protein